MKCKLLNVIGVAIVLTLSSSIAMAATPKRPALTGTYKLVGRTGKGDSIKTAPNVIGLLTFTKTYRNFNVAWKDANGKVFSYSVISKYHLTDSTYTETKLYSIMDDEISGAGVKYDFDSQTKTVPVSFDNGKLSIQLPFDPVTLIVDGDKLTGIGVSDFVDSWFKIR